MRQTTRVQGENIAVHDTVVVSFANEETIALVGIVANVERIRKFDEFSGDQLSDPELWFRDRRTDQVVGPVRRGHIATIGLVDGLWATPEEVENMSGQVSSIEKLYQSLTAAEADVLHNAIDLALDCVRAENRDKGRMQILRAVAEIDQR